MYETSGAEKRFTSEKDSHVEVLPHFRICYENRGIILNPSCTIHRIP